MVTQYGLFYTIEELRELTGLARSTIYNLTTQGVVPKPIRGLIPESPSKGLYRPEALTKIQKYLELRQKGLTAKEAIKELTS